MIRSFADNLPCYRVPKITPWNDAHGLSTGLTVDRALIVLVRSRSLRLSLDR